MTASKKPLLGDPLLYDLTQTAADLNCGLSFLRQEIAKGLLDTVRLGDRPMTTRAMREAYIARKLQLQRAK
jgi:hypothetical protein